MSKLTKGTRVVYIAGPPFRGKTGVVTRGHTKVSQYVLVLFDGDDHEIVIDPNNLELEKNNMTIKNQVLAALKALFGAAAKNPKDEAVRKLGVGIALASVADKTKKDAKKALGDLGILLEGDGIIFDGQSYTLNASTALPSSRLDALALSRALDKEGLSEAMKRRIIAASTVANKAAVTLTVSPK